MIFTATAFLWAVTVCGPIDAPPNANASSDYIEFCGHIDASRQQFEAGEFGNAYIAADAADRVSLYEWETSTQLLAMAETACVAGYPETGRAHVSTFICVSDIHSKNFVVDDWYDVPEADLYELMSNRYPYAKGWDVDFGRCKHAFEESFPNDFNYANDEEKALLYSEANRIKAQCAMAEETE